MALAGNNGRTEKGTPKRRNEARRKGQVARSANLVAAVIFVGVFVLLSYEASAISGTLADMLRNTLAGINTRELTVERLQELFINCATSAAGALAWVTGVALILGVGANAAQGGLVLSSERLGLHFEHLNPASGLKKLMPGMALMELVKSILTITTVIVVAYGVYTQAAPDLPRLMLMHPVEIAGRIGGMLYTFALKCGVVLILIGAVDYYVSRRRFEKSIMMTKQEIKDEAKNAEGNPEIRSKIRRKQREIAMRSLRIDVPKADVVITNPTHYAVALQYRPDSMAAPIVLAKGKGYVALRIRAIAEEHKVPLVENKPLAQGLYKAVNPGQQIPAELFKAVAEVLAYLYRLKSMRL